MRENSPTALGSRTLRDGNYVRYILVELRMKWRTIIFTGASARFITFLFTLHEHLCRLGIFKAAYICAYDRTQFMCSVPQLHFCIIIADKAY